jgi:hypothetical protein
MSRRPLGRTHTQLAPSELRDLAASDDATKLSALLPLVSLLQLEAAFQPSNGVQPRHTDEASHSPQADASRVIVNHGAIDGLDACASLLSADGFVLVNDYGPERDATSASSVTARRTRRIGRRSGSIPATRAPTSISRTRSFRPARTPRH